MSPRRKKESHLVNNVVIAVAILGFAFFYWRETRNTGAGAALRNPRSCLDAFVELYQQKRADILREDKFRPSTLPTSIKQIDPRHGWDGLDRFFTEESLVWLRDNANHISLGVADSVKEWEQWTPWRRYVYARGEILKEAPYSKYTVTASFEDKQGNAEMSVQPSTGNLFSVKFKKTDDGYQISDFFGMRNRWSDLARKIDMRLPPEMRIYR